MALSEKKRQSNNKWIKENYKQVKLSMPKKEAEALEEYCSSHNLSKAGFIRLAIKEKMERDTKTGTGAPGSGISTGSPLERVEQEGKPPIPQWIADRYPGEKWPVLKAVRAIQGNMNALRRLRGRMTQEQRFEWDKEFRRELDEERRQGARQDTPKPTCNLPLEEFSECKDLAEAKEKVQRLIENQGGGKKED